MALVCNTIYFLGTPQSQRESIINDLATVGGGDVTDIDESLESYSSSYVSRLSSHRSSTLLDDTDVSMLDLNAAEEYEERRRFS